MAGADRCLLVGWCLKVAVGLHEFIFTVKHFINQYANKVQTW